MRYEPNEDQAALIAALERLTASEDARWAVAPGEARCDWSARLDALIEENGFFDAAAEETLGPVAAAETVRRLAALPVLVEASASALLRPALAPDLPRPLAVLPAGPGAVAPFLPLARAVLRIGEAGVEAATLAEGDVETVESLHAYPMGRLAREDLAWTRLEADPAAAADLWRTALAAELAGVLQGGLDAVVAHVTQRRQFGRPLGSFQGIQHRLAGAAVKIEGARWLALRAAEARTPADPPEALGYAQRISTEVCYDLHQFMGAMGLTLEHPLHRWTGRARWLRSALGGADAALRLAASRRWGEGAAA